MPDSDCGYGKQNSYSLACASCTDWKLPSFIGQTSFRDAMASEYHGQVFVRPSDQPLPGRWLHGCYMRSRVVTALLADAAPAMPMIKARI